jgi:hypothetical protein
MNKELDVVLITIKDKSGMQLNFTLRGDGVAELKKKVEDVKVQWFDDMFEEKIIERPTQTQTQTGNCQKCGAVMKVSKMGKPYCSKLCWQQKTY